MKHIESHMIKVFNMTHMTFYALRNNLSFTKPQLRFDFNKCYY